MTGRHISDKLETLFSFELLVEYIRIDREEKVSDELALGVRLLDFPTLLIYQPEQRSNEMNHQNEKRGEYAFNRGKSCVFKMNLHTLHTHLSSSPLYTMLLDVKEEIPKLVGTSLISLAKVMDRIRQDVAERGVSAPSSHGERGLVGVTSLTGEKIGSISLSYKLLSLGASLLPHISERRGLKRTTVHEGQNVQESIKESDVTTKSLSSDCEKVQSSTPVESDVRNRPLIKEDKQDVRDATQIEHKPRSQMPQTLQDTENCFDEDLSVFCPPHLYYSNSGEEKSKNEGTDYKLLTQHLEAFTFEDTLSEEESSPATDQRARHKTKTSSDREQTSVVIPNVLGEALRQLPLLNALLVELSQFNGQNPHQPLSIHPNLAWIYRPASTEPSAGQGNTPRKTHTKSSQRTRQGANLKHSPRNCSTPIFRPASEGQPKNKHKEALIESNRKKLVYRTTKTFNLRLKQISPVAVKRRECMELIQNETQSSMTKGKTKCSHTIMKSSKRKSALNQSSSLDENIQTVIQSITAESALQDTITPKQKNILANKSVEKVHGKQDRESLQMSARRSERDLKCIHIPRVKSDSVAQNKDNTEHHSESNQSQSESDRHRQKMESSASSRHSSPKSSFSDSSGEGSEEADYADDFNSLEPSDAYSPDPASSPELARARTPKSPVRLDFRNSDSGSESVQRRAVLPVPVKARSSPQRALRGTHIIRPRTQASALSFSSDDGDRDGSASIRTVRSRKHTTESSKAERSSGAESFRSSRGQRSESTKNSGLIRGFSAESVSSLEPQEAEELEDELGSLDFRKEYQHISELVANKLPGYTM